MESHSKFEVVLCDLGNSTDSDDEARSGSCYHGLVPGTPSSQKSSKMAKNSSAFLSRRNETVDILSRFVCQSKKDQNTHSKQGFDCVGNEDLRCAQNGKSHPASKTSILVDRDKTAPSPVFSRREMDYQPLPTDSSTEENSEPDSPKSKGRITWQRSSRLGANINRKRKNKVFRYVACNSSSSSSTEEESGIEDTRWSGHSETSTSQQPARNRAQKRDTAKVVNTNASSGRISDTHSSFGNSRVSKKSNNLSSRCNSGEVPRNKLAPKMKQMMMLGSDSGSADSSDSESLLSPPKSKLQARKNFRTRGQNDDFLASKGMPLEKNNKQEETHPKNCKRLLNIDNEQVLGQKRARLSPVFGLAKSVSSGNSMKEKPHSKISHPTSSSSDLVSHDRERYINRITYLFGSESGDGSDATKDNIEEMRDEQRHLNHGSHDLSKIESLGVSTVNSKPLISGPGKNDKLIAAKTLKSLLPNNAEDAMLKKSPCGTGKDDTVILVDITQSAERGAMAGQVSPNANLNTSARHIDSEHVERSESPILVRLCNRRKPATRYDTVNSGTEPLASKEMNRSRPERPSVIVYHQQQHGSDNPKKNSPEICSPVFSHQMELPRKRDLRTWKHKAADGGAVSTGSSPKHSNSREITSQNRTPRDHLSDDAGNGTTTLHWPIAEKQIQHGVSSKAATLDLCREGSSVQEDDHHFPEMSFEENRLKWMLRNQGSTRSAFTCTGRSAAESPHFTSISISTSKQHSLAKSQGGNKSSQSSKETTGANASGENWRSRQLDDCERNSPIFERGKYPRVRHESSQSAKEKSISNQQAIPGNQVTIRSSHLGSDRHKRTVENWREIRSRQRSRHGSVHNEGRTSAEAGVRSRSRRDLLSAKETRVTRNPELKQKCTGSHERNRHVINLDPDETVLSGNLGDTGTTCSTPSTEAGIPNSSQEIINLDLDETVLGCNSYDNCAGDIGTNAPSTEVQVPTNIQNGQQNSPREQKSNRKSRREVKDIRDLRSRRHRSNSNSGSRVSRRSGRTVEPGVRLIGAVDLRSGQRVDSVTSEGRDVGAPLSTDLEIMQMIRQMEEDEAMAKQLQEHFDAEIASLTQQNCRNTPDLPQPFEYSSVSQPERSVPISLPQMPALPDRYMPPSLDYRTVGQEMVWRDDLADLNPVNIAMMAEMGVYLDNNLDIQGLHNRRTHRHGRGRGRSRGRHLYNRHLTRSPAVDGNDYEALLNLAETVGQVHSKGLPESSINLLPTFLFTSSGNDTAETECSICMCDYEAGETMRRLPCFHFYHATCIDKWLKENRICPVCREQVNFDPLNFN